MNVVGEELTFNLKNYDLDAIVLERDLAYDNGVNNCYYSWHTFFYMFDAYYKEIDRLVPIITAIGNHVIKLILELFIYIL